MKFKWRTGEIQMREFQSLTREEKDVHIKLLQSLPEDELSTNDISILHLETGNYQLKVKEERISVQKKYEEIYVVEPPKPYEVLIKKKGEEIKHNLKFYRDLIDGLIPNYPNWNQNFILMGKDVFLDTVEELYPETNLKLLNEFIDEMEKL